MRAIDSPNYTQFYSPESYRRVLKHEISHVVEFLLIGRFQYRQANDVWLREGAATYSGGAGAPVETVAELDAWRTRMADVPGGGNPIGIHVWNDFPGEIRQANPFRVRARLLRPRRGISSSGGGAFGRLTSGTQSLWDRPPFSESRGAVWIHLGLASAHLRRREEALCRERLGVALRQASAAGVLASMEAKLLDARLAVDEGDRDRARRNMDEAEAWLDEDDVEHVCYRARLNAQRAFLLTKPAPGETENVEAARALFVAIPEGSGIAFVDYRRTAGLAYCAYRLGARDEGRRLARLAAEYAGDGGFIRFRAMAFNLLSKMMDEPEAGVLRARARRLAASIEDLVLAHRPEKPKR